MKYFIFGWIGIGIMSLEGCGTLRTVAEGDATTRGNLTQVSSPCESIQGFIVALATTFA